MPSRASKVPSPAIIVINIIQLSGSAITYIKNPVGSWRPEAYGVSCMRAVDRAERHTLVSSLIQLRERLSTSLCVEHQDQLWANKGHRP